MLGLPVVFDPFLHLTVMISAYSAFHESGES
jgi:hypothetical protein